MKGMEIERISPVATRSRHETLLLVDGALLDRKSEDAAKSRRKREIHALHIGGEDRLQRMLNAIQPGSYIRPHRHLVPPQPEVLVILRGTLGFVTFDDRGGPLEDRFALLDVRREAFAVDLRAGLWHTFFALEKDTVLFEVKPGPYDPDAAKDFADWAPGEEEARAAEYLMFLEDRFRRVLGLPRRQWEP